MQDHWRRKYEEAFCRYADARGARSFGLGRQALFILLKALGVNPGERIGVCAYTCLAVVEAIKVSGAIPVYLDIDEHLCIDPNEILCHKASPSGIQDAGSLKAVILQHTFGNPGRFEQLLAACDKIGAKVIEDCAHTLNCERGSERGSEWNERKLGTWGQGAVHPGGMLTVNSNELLDEVDRQIERFAVPASPKSEIIAAWRRQVHHLFEGSRLDCYLGYNYSRLRSFLRSRESSFLKAGFPSSAGYVRPTGEMTAKAKLTQLENWPILQQTRLYNTAMIEEYFSKAGLSLWPRQPQAKSPKGSPGQCPKGANITMMRYPLRVYKKWEIVHRAGMRGLDIAGWYVSPVHPLGDSDLAKVDYRRGSCPGAEGMIERIVHLPTGPSLNKHKLEAMIEIIQK